MTINIFSILAMLAEPERVFSEAKNALSNNWVSMGMNTIQKIQCLKSWFYNNLFTKDNISQMMQASNAMWDLIWESSNSKDIYNQVFES